MVASASSSSFVCTSFSPSSRSSNDRACASSSSRCFLAISLRRSSYRSFTRATSRSHATWPRSGSPVQATERVPRSWRAVSFLRAVRSKHGRGHLRQGTQQGSLGRRWSTLGNLNKRQRLELLGPGDPAPTRGLPRHRVTPPARPHPSATSPISQPSESPRQTKPTAAEHH